MFSTEARKITYKAKQYKTYSETIRAVIWENSKKIKLICSKNEYKTINGTESPSPWGGMEKLPRSYNHWFRNNQDYGWNVNKRNRAAPTNYLQHSNCVTPAARVHQEVPTQPFTWSVFKCESPGIDIEKTIRNVTPPLHWGALMEWKLEGKPVISQNVQNPQRMTTVGESPASKFIIKTECKTTPGQRS